MRTILFAAAILLPAVLPVSQATAEVTVLFNDREVVIQETLPDADDLWVAPEFLTAINGFELKPQGACLDEICIPIRQDEDSDLFVRRDGRSWINATEFANKVQQPFVADREHSVYSFGAVPASRKPFLESAVAPDFELKDREGKSVRLSDFRGKKVMIITWASW